MSTSSVSSNYHAIGQLYAGMTKESIRADINAMTFKSAQDREKAYNKQIKLFDYANSLVESEVDDIISEREVEAYSKKEKNKKVWKNAAIAGICLAATAIASFVIHKNINVAKVSKALKSTENSKIIVSDISQCGQSEVAIASRAMTEKSVVPVVKDVESVMTPTVTAEMSVLEHASVGVTPEFKEKLDLYNACKLLKSEKYNTGTQILNGWKSQFGVQTNGTYKNLIDELSNNGAIEKYIHERFPSITSKSEVEQIKTVLIGYLEKNLDIYTYPRINKILESFHPEIMQKLKDGAIIYMPNKEKSYNLITQMYKEINPDAKIIEGYNNLKMFLKDKKGMNIIVLDDCLVSGSSAIGLHKNIFLDIENAAEKVKSLDLYLLNASEYGLAKVPKEFNVHYSVLKGSLKQSDYFKKELLNQEKQLLISALGTCNPEYNVYSATMFPYMTPNNNSLFSAHMFREIFTGPECAIKGIFNPVELDNKKIEDVRKALTALTSPVAA